MPRQRTALSLFRRGEIWWLRGTIRCGQRKQRVLESTGARDYADAQAVRDLRGREIWDSLSLGDRASVPFGQAARSYLEQRQPRAGDARRIARLVAYFGPRQLREIGQAAVDGAVKAICRPEAAPGTRLRSVIIPLTAILTHAARRGWCDTPHFERPEQPKGRTVWLTPAQARALVDAASPHLRPLLVFFLCTGARVAEALDMQWSDVDLQARTCIFRDTKSGADRIVKLAPAAWEALANLPHRDGAVFRRPGRAALPVGAAYADRGRDEGGQIKTAFNGARRRAGLPSDVTPHALRHTWATWFQAVTRDPMRLKHEGGWGSLAMVERYAHLAPSAIAAEVVAFWGAGYPDRTIDAQQPTGHQASA